MLPLRLIQVLSRCKKRVQKPELSKAVQLRRQNREGHCHGNRMSDTNPDLYSNKSAGALLFRCYLNAYIDFTPIAKEKVFVLDHNFMFTYITFNRIVIRV